MLNEFEYRNMAPHFLGSWISDIEVPAIDDNDYEKTYYVALRNGGVWKTVNNGVTFFPIFENYGTSSIGAIQVAPSDPEVIWIGTGDDFNSRLSRPGNGVWKSTDGGSTFQHMGLKGTDHIAKIVINPNNKNIVYVAAMGPLFSKSDMRGVFKTINGGKTWEKVLYINDHTGVIDLAINPQNPKILYAATYDMRRYPWGLRAGGSDSDIYKTTDAGASWKRLKGGLPNGKLGRIGIDIYRHNPDILYAVVQNLNPRKNDSSKVKGGEVYRTANVGKTWKQMNPDTVNLSIKEPHTFSKIMIDPNDPGTIYVSNVSVQVSNDRGKTWQNVGVDPSPTPSLLDPARLGLIPSPLFSSMFGDIRTMWIDPEDSNHLMMGSDGGLYVTYDGGKTMRHLYHVPGALVYNVEVDDVRPYNIYVSLQDHEVWKTPSNSYNGAIGISQWDLVGKWDGQDVEIDHKNNRWLYVTSQYGGHRRVDQLKGERILIEPEPPKKGRYRYTWTTPLEISSHDSDIIYTGGQMLLRSKNKGKTWQEISPDLTTNNKKRLPWKELYIVLSLPFQYRRCHQV